MAQSTASSTALQTRFLNPDGSVSWTWLQLLRQWQQQLKAGFDSAGNLISKLSSTVAIVGRSGTIGSILRYIDENGVVEDAGIDFTRNYLHKDTDHINDGTGSPLAGGKTAFAALDASGPVAGQILGYNGLSWQPQAAPQTTAAAPSEWLDSYDASSGSFTRSQPAFSDISGEITAAQLPGGGGLSVTITTAALTPTGTQGSMTFTNGLLTAQTPAT